MKILYVEDDPKNADLVRRALAKAAPQYVLDIVGTYQEALARLEQAIDYNLVLTDLKLPDGDGMALLAYIRERALPAAVVVISGRGDEETAVAALKSGADDYIVRHKDYLKTLFLTLESALQRNRTKLDLYARPLRVLYAEHYASDIDLTRRHLAQYAPYIRLEVVNTPSEIKQRLSDTKFGEKYDVILLDYNLPGLNTLNLLKDAIQVRRVGVPIIIVTGQGSEEVAAQALKLGAADYVVKNPGYLFHLPGVLENAFHRTQLVREQDALHKSESRYRTLAEVSPVGIFHTDAQGLTTYINKRWCEISGLSAEKALGNGWLKAVHPDDYKNLSVNWQAAVLEQNVSMADYRFLKPDGTVTWVIGQAIPEKDENGHILSYVGTITDITERKRAEEQLRYQATLLINVNDAIVASDAQYRLTAWNAAAEALYGWKAEEVLGRNELEIVRTEWPGVEAEEMLRMIAEAGHWRGEATQTRRDGTKVPVDVSSIVLRDKTGQITGYVSVIRDITERQRVEASLRRSQQETAHVNRLLLALSQASETVQRALTTADVYRAIEDQVTCLNYHVTGFEFAEDDRSLAIAYLNYKPELVRKAEKMVKLSLRDFHFRPRTDSIFQRVIDKGETVFVKDAAQSIADALPKNLRALARPVANLFKLDQSIFAPLTVGEEMKGVLSITGPDLSEADCPAITTFARQAAIAMQNARLYEQAQQEIAERKRAEEALVEERNLLRTMIDNLPDRIYVMDAQGRKTVSNIADWKACGAKKMEDVLGKKDFDTYPADLAAEFWALDKAVIDSGVPVINCEEHGLDSQGKPVWVLSTKVPLRDGQGKVVGLVGIGRDITERKRAEEQIQILSKIPGESPNPIMRATPEGILLYANRTSAPLLTMWKTQVGQGLPEEWRAKIKEVFNSGLYQEVECQCGEKVYSLILAPIVDAGYINLYGREITKRKQAEEALASQTEDLRERNEELDHLYRATGSLLSSTPFELQNLAKTIVEVILQDFGQANCSVFLIRKDTNELDRLAVAGPFADQVRNIVLTLEGTGLIPKAIRSGQLINTPDVRGISAYVPGWELARSELTIPLKVGDQVIGAIDVQSAEPDAFKPDDERLMSIFAERAALALERGRLNEELERRILQLTSLRTIDIAISSSMDMNLILGILLDQLTKHLGVDAADVLLFDPRLQTFKYATGQGFHTQALQHTKLRLGDGYAGRAARERQVVMIRDLPRNTGGLQRSADFSREGFLTYVGVPLIAKGQVKGVLEIMQREPLELDQEQCTFLDMLAGQAAIAIDSAQLFENLQGSNSELMMAYDETIEGWSRAMDLRDKETEGHTQRVTELTLRLANSMGFGAEELVHIRRGTLLHDIGKMGVPDEILRKPGPLSEEEWVIMRKHPQLAYDMLAPIIYLRPALDIPYCHHEKWDGTGYPRGLKAEQIPLVARIFAVVDVWDALSSDRPYRKAWPEDKVRQYIREQAGKHFDAHLVEIFLKEVSNVE